MRKRVVSACLAMALFIAMIPHFCLGVEAAVSDEWYDFISTRAFWDYMSDSQSHKEENLEYAVFDLNSDGVTELLLQDTWDAPFYSTWLFVLQDGKIVLAHEDYGYGMYRYSPQYNMVIGSPATKPFSGTGTSPFYSLSGTEFKYEFQIGQDMGVSFYSDASGQRTISEEERASYYEDVVWLSFSPVSEVPETEPSEQDSDLIDQSQKTNEDHARAEWIKQHMEYASSDEYESEIKGGYSEWMLAAFRDACEDSDVNSFQTRKRIVSILDLDFEFSESEMYELILAELLYGNTGLGITEEAYAQRLRTGAADISKALVNIANSTDGIGDDIRKSINNLYETLQTLEFGSDTYGKTYSELISMVGQNVSDMKGKLKEDAVFAGCGILLDAAFEQYDALEDVLTYINNYIAYQSFSQQTRAVLQQLVLKTFVEYEYGMNELVDELGSWDAWVNWASFQIALEEIIAAMEAYESQDALAVAAYAVEREKLAAQQFETKTIKTVSVFAAEKALSCIPVMNAILTAKNIISAGLQASVVLDMIFTNVGEREYAIDILVKAYCISFVLDETVESCAGAMTEDDFFSATVFDESVSIYRKNQLLASDYMLKYADLVVADLLMEVEELELREQELTGIEKEDFQFLIRKIWERLSWYSRHLKDLKAERAAVEAISCHDSNLQYDPFADEIIYSFEDSRIYVVACPVDVIVTSDTGEQIAYLSGENNQVADGYEFYFHTIKAADDSGEYIKVAIVPDSYQIELKGTADGIMHAFVADYTAGDVGEVESYFNIPIERDSVGYFGSNDGDEGQLVMDRVSYSNMESVEDIPTESGNGTIVLLCIGLACAVLAIILIRRKRSNKQT